MAKGITTDIPADCVLISAKDVRVGDRVRFRASFADYTVEEVSSNIIGVCHLHGDGAASSSYHPGELLWITRREPAPCKGCGQKIQPEKIELPAGTTYEQCPRCGWQTGARFRR